VADEGRQVSKLLDAAASQHEEARARGETELPEFTENAVARRFARQAEGTLAYDHSACGWLVWSGAVWSADRLGRATEQVRIFVEAERKSVIEPREFAAMARVRFVSAVEQISRSDTLLAVNQDLLDADPWLLGTPKGVVDLRTGEMQPGRPRDFITRHTAVAPAPPGTKAPHWLAFLHQATEGDDELLGFLRRWAGYCLSGDVTEEVLTFLYGDGGNGKGVFVGAISAVMGNYAVSQPMEAFTAGARLPAEYYRAQMAGARLVMASETESGRVWAESQLKELTGNEAPVSARHPHGRPFSYMPQFKVQFVGNHAPSLKGRSPAMERRLRVVPFTHKPACPDHGLKNRLRDEGPAILRWMIDGCQEWQRVRLGTPAAIRQASGKYFQQQDAFGRWLEERCVLNVMSMTRPGELFSDYRVWCAANGETALTSQEFAEQRDRTNGLILKTRDGVRWVAGVGLRPGPDAAWDR
jgi:putative DNA primase/helicase